MGSEPVIAISDLAIVPTQTSNANATYVLALTDPDATSRSEPVKGQMCHWIVANVTIPLYTSEFEDPIKPLSTSKYYEIAGGSGMVELMTYFPPAPPPKTGYHRYVFVVLAPKTDKKMGKELKRPKDRPHWGYGTVGAGVREWAEENQLVVIGQSRNSPPIAIQGRSGPGVGLFLLIVVCRSKFLLLREQRAVTGGGGESIWHGVSGSVVRFVVIQKSLYLDRLMHNCDDRKHRYCFSIPSNPMLRLRCQGRVKLPRFSSRIVLGPGLGGLPSMADFLDVRGIWTISLNVCKDCYCKRLEAEFLVPS